MPRSVTNKKRTSRTTHARRDRKKAGRRDPQNGRGPRGEKRFRLGRLQRLVLTAVAETERNADATSLAELSRMVAAVRGHTRRPDRKKVHKNTFYRAVQALCEKGYVRRGSSERGLRLLAKGRRVIEERDLSWEQEKSSARKVERRLLQRQIEWRKEGRRVGGTRRRRRARLSRSRKTRSIPRGGTSRLGR